MAWNDGAIKLTEKQKEMAQIAGIPTDRPGLGAEYPKAVYRKAEGPGAMLYGEPFKVAGHQLDIAEVANAEEEAEATAQGWFLSPDLEVEQKRKDALAEAAEEIATLKAEIAAAKPREQLKAKTDSLPIA